jgi:hypothetical protein
MLVVLRGAGGVASARMRETGGWGLVKSSQVK